MKVWLFIYFINQAGIEWQQPYQAFPKEHRDQVDQNDHKWPSLGSEI